MALPYIITKTETQDIVDDTETGDVVENTETEEVVDNNGDIQSTDIITHHFHWNNVIPDIHAKHMNGSGLQATAQTRKRKGSASRHNK